MKQMFESATLKLTVWYLLILMTICIFFSVIIYQISSAEVSARLDTFEERFDIPLVSDNATTGGFGEFRASQVHETQLSLFIALLYSNIAILVLGGVGSYLLARRTLQPIEASHEAQARFTSDASHELRTPLAVMKSELEVALRGKDISKTELREILESNLEEVNRLSELSMTLLQLSRQDYANVEMEKASLGSIVIHAVATLDIPPSRLEIDIPKKITVVANRSSLTELVMILLDNALRYSPADSTVSVKAAGRGKSSYLTISNSGKGISPEDLPHIFDRFYRGDKSRTAQAQPGYGLGLSLAKMIAEVHDATIDITSTPDVITTVIVRFKR